ncbi:MAG TPA: iron-sulfur cluster assembly accessory protein, partial [Afipia sp.]|nr:iron-sulfur cluster assembly accessory protein [Afipia sp.]
MTATELASAAGVTISERAAKRIGAILKSEGDGA